MFPAGFPSRAVLNRHHDNAVDQRFGLFGGAHCLFVVNLADGVSSVGDQHHHLPSLPAIE